MPHQSFGIREAAEYLHVSEAEVRELIRTGEIPYNEAGRRVVLRLDELDGWASRRVLGLSSSKVRALHHGIARRYQVRGEVAVRVSDLLGVACIEPALDARTRASVLRKLSSLAVRTGCVADSRGLIAALEAREALGSTALPGGVAVVHPEHRREWMFTESFVLLARTRHPVPFGAPDGGLTDVFFLLALDDARLHLPVLSRVCVICHHTDLLLRLREASSAGAMWDAVRAAEEQVMRS